MQKKNLSKSRFFNLRPTTVCALFSAASLLAYLGFAASARDWRDKIHPDVLASATAGQTEILIYLNPVADLSGAARPFSV